MFSFICFGGGFIIGLSILGLVSRFWKKTKKILEEQKNQLSEEKKIAVEFMHNLAEAIGEGVQKEVLYQRVVHTAVITTGAMSACIYERLPNGRLKGVAVEGLFPPQREIKFPTEEKGTPRARFIEKVLNSEILEAEEGIVGTNDDEIKDIVETFEEQIIPKDVDEADDIELKLARFAALLELSPVSLKKAPTLFPESGSSSPVPSSDLEGDSQQGDDLKSTRSNESPFDTGRSSPVPLGSEPVPLGSENSDQGGQDMYSSEQLAEFLAQQKNSGMKK